MATIPATFRNRWRSRDHVGVARPTQQVRIRTGYFAHGYEPWADLGSPVSARIPGEAPHLPWQATWTPLTAWADIPNVLEVNLEQDFDANGIQRLTMQIENVLLAEESHLSNLYHVFKRGYFSPYLGMSANGRSVGEQNEWHELLNANAEILIEQGYGDRMVIVFHGLLDKVDFTSKPDRITATGRDFGQNLTDQRVFGHAKSKQIFSPITFADRYFADETDEVGGGAAASESLAGYPPRFICDKSKDTAWKSDSHEGPNPPDVWCQIRVTRGRYSSFSLMPDRDGMRCYVSVYAKSNSKMRAELDGEPIPEGWVDVGKGSVNGIPWIKRIEAVPHDGRIYRLSDEHDLQLADDSIIRLHWRNLQRGDGSEFYRAGVRRFVALRRSRKQEAKDRRWILVDDWSDVVKVVLRWAGFKDWEVETTGARLEDNTLVFNAGDFLIDVIRKITEFVNFSFFIREPDSADSIGVPVFRSIGALREGNYSKAVESVRGEDLLTGIQVTLDEEPLPFNIRVRGREVKRGSSGSKSLGSDPVNRPHYHFRPPWQDRLAGVIKHDVHTDLRITDAEQCKRACYLIGLASALKSATGVIEIPGNPGFELDDQVTLIDEGAGIASRLWIASRQSTFRAGAQASWKMSLGGSFLDLPDVRDMIRLLWKLDADDNSPQSYPVIPRVSKGERQPVSG